MTEFHETNQWRLINLKCKKKTSAESLLGSAMPALFPFFMHFPELVLESSALFAIGRIGHALAKFVLSPDLSPATAVSGRRRPSFVTSAVGNRCRGLIPDATLLEDLLLANEEASARAADADSYIRRTARIDPNRGSQVRRMLAAGGRSISNPRSPVRGTLFSKSLMSGSARCPTSSIRRNGQVLDAAKFKQGDCANEAGFGAPHKNVGNRGGPI
jgi:hypothetical protein